MKELTQEEKAKRYDEAIKIARKINSGEGVATPSDWTVCEVIFPELRESEDERIIKSITRLIKAFYDVNFPTPEGFSRKDLLAWLEKQGEHTNFRNKIQIGDKVTRNEDGVLINLSQLNRVAKKDEKQGEQKDILENTILDGNEDGLVAETIHYKKETQDKQKSTEWEPQTGDTFRKKGTTSPTYHLCNKREDGITFGFVENCEVGIAGGEITIFALKSDYELVKRPRSIEDVIEEELNKGLQTKVGQSIVWSEEDIRLLDNCISLIEDIDCTKEEQNWLKSLKSRSQLSEEQIKKDLNKAANEWDCKASFSPIAMVMDGDRPIGTKQHITSHADSFKAGVDWVIKKLREE